MLELVVLEKEVGKLAINYDELKSQLSVQLQQFKDMEVTENAITEAKGVRANLNRVAKIIDDRRKELKKEFLKPYEIVDTQAKELTNMINEVVSSIDNQIKTFEEQKKVKKKEDIINIWTNIGYNKVSLEQLWEDSWLNKTVSLKSIESDIREKITDIESDLSNIESLVEDKAKVLDLQTKYLISLDLQTTISAYKQEQERKALLEQEQSKKVDKEVSTSETPIVDDEQKYFVTLEFNDTYKNLELLTIFLKENKINYRRV